MKTLVILPTYNEKANLGRIVPRILEVDRNLEILIIDDNSPDGTGELADRLAGEFSAVHVIHRPAKQGLASAYIEGFRFGIRGEYDLIFEMDADLSHDPRYLPDFLQAAANCDVVLGSRYLDGVNVVNWPLHRVLLSYFANLYARLVTGLPIRDLTGGFKCFRRQALEALDLERIFSEGYGFQIEVTYRSFKKGFVIREIPIIFYDRCQGSSKISRKIVFEAFWGVWKLRALDLLNRL